MQPSNLNDLVLLARKKSTKRLVVVAADDFHLLNSIKASVESNLVEPILIGNSERIISISNQLNFSLNKIEIIDVKNTSDAAMFAIKLIKENRADILMKGMVPTQLLLRAVLDKENGLAVNGLLSHFAIIQVSSYHKLLSISDVAMNISPTLDEKKIIITNAVKILHTIGYDCPKIAVICPIEVVNQKIESTVHAKKLKEMWVNKEIEGCIVDGPLALDNAISKEASTIKNIASDVAGDADFLLVPDLNSGNILYKSLCYFAGATTAAVIAGAGVPIVLTSRTDSEKSKFYSIALAACM